MSPLPALPPEVTSVAVDVTLHYVLAGFDQIARRASPALARTLGKRFGAGGAELIAGPDLETAQTRLKAFTEDLDVRVRRLEESGAIDDPLLDKLFALPEVTGAFQTAFESAMEIDDPLMRQTLADLVTTRLCAKDRSAWGPAARNAIERIRDVTPQQIRLLGLILFLDLNPISAEISRLEGTEQRDAYRQWILEHVPWALNVQYVGDDFAHLAGLGLIDYDLSRGFVQGLVLPALFEPLRLNFPELGNDDPVKQLRESIERFYHTFAASGIPAVAACRLTPSGQLIAANVLREERKIDVEL